MRKFRYEKRTDVSMARKILHPVIFVLLALLFCALLL